MRCSLAGDGEELSYPPLEGEGRPHRTKRSFFLCGRGGVIVHPQPIHPVSLAAHPTPSRIALCATRADPPPPGEGKLEMRESPVFTGADDGPRRLARARP